MRRTQGRVVTRPAPARIVESRLRDSFLGIDIGTSSAKALLRQESREESVRAPFASDPPGPAAWLEGCREAVARLRERAGRALDRVAGIGLSGQTNTYVLWSPDRGDRELPVIPWSHGGGRAELAELLRLPASFFVDHISMQHPAMVSYPAPRILWMQRTLGSEWQAADRVLQPKDWAYLRLTGSCASDPFTWRGLAHLGDASFHGELLDRLGLEAGRLPELHAAWAAPGRLTREAAGYLGLRSGVPVVLGCNDFFASLLGMGSLGPGDWFDVAGSSEHVGRIETRSPLSVTTPLVYGPCLAHNVHYGVTAASGVSLDWALQAFGADKPAAGDARAPLFLPYLQGERAPLFDPDARGVLFGVDRGHGPRDLFYAVCEGVAFSLLQIAALIDSEATDPVRTSLDGPLAEPVTQLKADVFQRPFHVVRQKACAALGAAMLAAVGAGLFASPVDAAREWAAVERVVEPRPERARLIRERYELYESLYPALKASFGALARLKGEAE